MKLSYNWLKEFLPGLKITPEKLAEVLNLHVAQVEKIENLGEGLDKVIVAEILEIKQHPNANKLQIAKVKTKYPSSQVANYLTIVCGAPNIRVGQKVPLGLAGAKLANGLELKKSVIRGVTSEGMLCAEDELGIGKDHTEIYILPVHAKPGLSVKKVLGLDDTILEIENKSITHRPDLFNHIGFAREISAIVKSKRPRQAWPAKADKYQKGQGKLGQLKLTKTQIKNQKVGKDAKQIEVKVEDKKLCPRYMAVVMDGVKVGPSPQWMQARLRNLGIRPINNVVDITNYVLMELGQPLHAFDYHKIADQGGQDADLRGKGQRQSAIIVRRAKKGEKLLALDSKEYELNENDLVIADSQKPIAIAGVMGGDASGVTEKTKTIVIESANFDPVSIRRTSWRLGLRTDSALRFEKGLALCCPCAGLERARELVEKIAQASLSSKIIDLKSKLAQKELREKKKIILRFDCLNRLVGEDIPARVVVDILRRLGCKILEGKKDKVRITVPRWRRDISLEEDIIEEIVRIYGINKIKPRPILAELRPIERDPEFILEKKIRDILVGSGFDEVYNYSFGLKEKDSLEVANPLNAFQQYLRTSLVPGLVKNAEENIKNFPEFKIFEIGKVFFTHSARSITNYELSTNIRIMQPKRIAGLICREDKDILRLTKGVIELILDKLGIEEEKIIYEIGPHKLVLVSINSIRKIGFFSQIEKNIAVFELNLEALTRFVKEKKFQPISFYPPIKRDLAFLIDKKITWQEMARMVKDASPLIWGVELFDVFEDKRFGEKRNFGFHIIYQAGDRTLKAEEIDRIQEKIIKALEEKFDARLRDF